MKSELIFLLFSMNYSIIVSAEAFVVFISFSPITVLLLSINKTLSPLRYSIVTDPDAIRTLMLQVKLA